MTQEISSSYETERMAAQLACATFGIDQDAADELLDTPTGSAILTLLANAAAHMALFEAESNVRYEHKRLLLRRAIRIAQDWWATPHTYGEYADTCVYIETPFARFAYHCRRADPYLADLLASAPTSDRGWSGQPLQPYAEPLAYAFVEGVATAQKAIAALHRQEPQP